MKTALRHDEFLAAVRKASSGGKHPRLFLSGDDRDAILAKTESGICREMADRLRMKCEAYLDPEHEQYFDSSAYDSDALLARPGQYVLGRIMMELSFGGWLWSEARYSDVAKGIVLRRAREAFLTPCGSDPNFSHYRSPLGIGSTGLALAWTADLLRPLLTDEEWRDIVDHIRRYYIDYARTDFFEEQRLKAVGFNKTLAGMCAVGQLTLVAAEDLSDSDVAWGVGEAYRSALGYCREGMDDDGGTYEGPGYGGHCIGRAIILGEALRRHGLPFFSQYEPFHRYGRFIGSILVPGGGTVSLGDSHGHANVIAEILILANWFKDHALQWTYLRGLGRSDHPVGPFGDSFALWGSILPQQLAWYDRDLEARAPEECGWSPNYHARGMDYAALRTGWSEKEDVLAVLSGCGRRATAAAHLTAEAGALDLWACGQELLFDPGYGLSTTDAHSAVQVKGNAPSFGKGSGNALFGGRIVRFAEGKFASLASADMAQMLDCRWAFRDVVLVHGNQPYVIVADDLNYRSDWSEYDWFWQAHPEARISTPDANGPGQIVTNGVTLDIFCYAPTSGTYPRDHEVAWHAEKVSPESWSNRDNELNRLRMSVSGYNGLMLSVLIPRRDGSPVPSIERVECLKPGVALRVNFADASDTIVFQPYNRFLETESSSGNGRLAVVREKGGAAVGYVLVDGYDLTWRGDRLVEPQQRAGEFIEVR